MMDRAGDSVETDQEKDRVKETDQEKNRVKEMDPEKNRAKAIRTSKTVETLLRTRRYRKERPRTPIRTRRRRI